MPSRPFALFSLGLSVVLGCAPPTHVLLSSKCAAGSDAADACKPAAPTKDWSCQDSSECTQDEACIKGSCVPCAKLVEACSSCPTATQAFKVLAGNCVTCECRPDCKVHRDCGKGQLCAAGSCVDCKATSSKCPDQCPWGFSPLPTVHNGCAVCECVPPNQCGNDADCGAGSTCYPGAQCDDGCSDPSCCHGNLCSDSGCKPPADSVSCAVVGCAAGQCRGDDTCKPGACRCNLTSTPVTLTGWECSGTACDAKCWAD